MNLTPNQIHELLEIIDKNTILFISHNVGTEVLSEQDKAILRLNGIDISKIQSSSSKVYEAYKFGMLSTILQKNALDRMTYPQMKEAISKLPKFNSLQQKAYESLQFQTYQDIKKLNGKMKSDTTDIFVKADRKRNTVQHTKLVTDAAKQALEKRRWTQEVVSILGKQTGQWDRDLGRIADYVLHTAFDEGRAAKFQESGGDDKLVYKDVYPGACKHCQSAFLTGGIGSEPKVFSLKELRKNATNIGRKVAEWLPVIGPMHPFCRCTLEECPEGFTIADKIKGIWFWNGMMWERDWGKTSEHNPRKVERKSKVKVSVNRKNYEV